MSTLQACPYGLNGYVKLPKVSGSICSAAATCVVSAEKALKSVRRRHSAKLLTGEKWGC